MRFCDSDTNTDYVISRPSIAKQVRTACEKMPNGVLGAFLLKKTRTSSQTIESSSSEMICNDMGFNLGYVVEVGS